MSLLLDVFGCAFVTCFDARNVSDDLSAYCFLLGDLSSVFGACCFEIVIGVVGQYYLSSVCRCLDKPSNSQGLFDVATRLCLTEVLAFWSSRCMWQQCERGSMRSHVVRAERGLHREGMSSMSLASRRISVRAIFPGTY